MAHTASQRLDVDHEMSHALWIAQALSATSPAPPVTSALRVAFAAHYRALMEFLHDGRPNGKSDPKDLHASDFLPPGSANPNRWTSRDKPRFDAADKLLGHLSRARARRRHTQREWGGPQDHAVLALKIERFMEAVPQASDWFPNTFAIIRTAHGGAHNA